MAPSLAISLDALGGWRAGLARRLDDLTRYLAERDLMRGATAPQIASLRDRLTNEKLVLAFVAEFSRGKSELINAIFFADTGRRILPATPGRTTMCPVELGWDAGEPAALSLLPIETRLEGVALGELKHQPRAWRRFPLDLDDVNKLAESLQEVTRTEWVERERARALGFWDDERPDDNPPSGADGRVEVPAWRHALINYPHPLLKRGLVVLDTPGLNAIGAEPELTLSLLPTAHATVFILGADTGVTRSDMAIWRDHLGAQAASRFVVLNKIDALEDPLATPEQVQAQIAAQQQDTARALAVPSDRVFPLSARQALAARVSGDAAGLRASCLPALEEALGAQLLPQRRALLEQVVLEGTQQIEFHAGRHIGDQRRQLAEQMLELRGLRGRNASKVRMMLQRIDAESAEFEHCTALLQAMRSVHARMLKEVLLELSSDRLRDEVDEMQRTMGASALNLGGKKAFAALCARLQALLVSASVRSGEVREMLEATFTRLNAEFGFSLALGKSPEVDRYAKELRMIESNYVQYLGLTLALRLSQPKFMEQFRLMLLSKLRVVFESASSEIELWNRATSAQVDSQLRERRKGFKHRRESLERIQSAGGELEQSLAQLEAQDQRLVQQIAKLNEMAEALREHACAAPLGADFDGAFLPSSAAGSLASADQGMDLPLFDEVQPIDERRVPA